MSYAALLERARREDALLSVLVELTYRCNLDCFFCYNDVSLRGQPLQLEQYFALFEDLAQMGVLNLVLSGGEPLAHADFFTVGRKARELGFLVRVKSNGHALRGRLAERLREEVDPFVVELSLHGASAAVHDRQTRVAGSFERLLANIGEMRRLGLRLKLNSTLTRWNEGEVAAMFALADRLGVPLHVDPEVTPRDDGDCEPLDIQPSGEAIAHLFRLLAERATAQGGAVVSVGRQDAELMAAAAPDKHCGAGSTGLAVDPFGNVYPCVQWRRAVGNLHRHSIREIWAGNGDLGEVRELNREVRRRLASVAEPGTSLSYCPGVAVTRSGDPLAFYDTARTRWGVLASERRRRGSARSLPVLDQGD